MATAAHARDARRPDADAWYRLSPGDAAARFEVDPATGLSGERAAQLLEREAPNALPAEQAISGWKRLAGQYRSYMQVIPVAAAIVSLAIKGGAPGSCSSSSRS